MLSIFISINHFQVNHRLYQSNQRCGVVLLHVEVVYRSNASKNQKVLVNENFKNKSDPLLENPNMYMLILGFIYIMRTIISHT